MWSRPSRTSLRLRPLGLQADGASTRLARRRRGCGLLRLRLLDEWAFFVSTDDAYVKADSTIVAPKVSGYLAEVLVEDNQPVKAGDVLARIDDRDFRAALNQARADVAAADASVHNLGAAINLQGAEIAQAKADATSGGAQLRRFAMDRPLSRSARRA